MSKYVSMVNHQDLILALIKHEFKYNKLIFGLTRLGLLGECYFPDLERIIYNLLDFEEKDKDEKLFKIYDSFKNKIIGMDIKEFTAKLNEISMDLYIELVAEKRRRSDSE